MRKNARRGNAEKTRPGKRGKNAAGKRGKMHQPYVLDTSENHNSELDLSVNSSEIYGKSRAIGPSPIQNCDFHL
jgi:hypothetical protein